MANKERKDVRRIKREYLLALSILASIILVSFLILQRISLVNTIDAKRISSSERQCAYSQEISKAVIGLNSNTGKEKNIKYIDELSTALEKWKTLNESFKDSNNDILFLKKRNQAIEQTIDELQTVFSAIQNSSEKVLEITAKPSYSSEEIEPFLDHMEEDVQLYIEGMRNVSLQLEQMVEQRMELFKLSRIVVSFLVLLDLTLLTFVIFGPSLRYISKSIKEISETNLLLQREKELFVATITSIREAFMYIDDSGKVVLMNAMAEEYTGWTIQKAYGQRYQTVLQSIVFNSENLDVDPIQQIIESGGQIESVTFEGVSYISNNEVSFRGHAAPVLSVRGELTGVVMAIRDISKEYELENEIENFLNINIDMLCVSDSEGKFIKVNNQFVSVLGYEKDELIGENLLDLVHEEDLESTLQAIKDVNEGSPIIGFINRYRCKDGSYKYIEWHSKMIGKNAYSSARDVTSNILREEELSEKVIRDKLTNLYNRYYLYDSIGKLMENADRYDEPIAFSLLDLDHFKLVNDKWGHLVGDDVLKMTAEIMANEIRETDILVRFGGEEFLIVMPHTDPDGAYIVAEKIRVKMENYRFPIAGRVTVSMGIANRIKAESFRHCYYRVDKALYEAKDSGRNCIVVSKKENEAELSILRIDWEKRWESGNTLIDDQHKEMLQIGNQLINLCIEGTATKEIQDKLVLLINQIVKHFEMEEIILKDINYAEYGIHREIHEQLLKKVTNLKKLYILGEVMPSAFYSFIMDDVLIGHMEEEDAKYFDCLAKEEGRPK